MRSTHRGTMLRRALLTAATAVAVIGFIGLGLQRPTADATNTPATISVTSNRASLLPKAQGDVETTETLFTLSQQVYIEGNGSVTDVEAEIYDGGTTTLVTTAMVANPDNDNFGTWTAAGLPAAAYQIVLHYVGAGNFIDVTEAPSSSGGCETSSCTANLTVPNAPANYVLPLAGMEEANEISGVITGVDAGPLGGITVKLDESSIGNGPSGFQTTTTNAEGSYDFQHVVGTCDIINATDPSGKYVSIGWQQSTPYDSASCLTPTWGQFSYTVSMELPLASTLSGTISVPGGTQADASNGNITAELFYQTYSDLQPYWMAVKSIPVSYVSPGIFRYALGGAANADLKIDVVYDGVQGLGTAQVIEPVASDGGTLDADFSISTTPVTPGQLVTSTDANSPVYLFDGGDAWFNNAVPSLDSLDSSGAAADMGVSGSPVVISDLDVSVLKDGQTQTLAHVIDCADGSIYFAGNGGLWPINAHLVNIWARTHLASTTCGNLHVATVPTLNALFVRSSGSSTIWEVTSEETKVAVTSPAEMNALAAPNAPVVLTVSASYISGLQTANQVVVPGELIEFPTILDGVNNSIVYLVDGTNDLVPVDDMDYAAALGLSTSVNQVSFTAFDAYDYQSNALGSYVSCGGLDYIAGSGKIWPISPVLVGSSPVTALQPATCAVLSVGAADLGSALFVRASDSPTIWYVDPARTRHVITSAAAMTSLAAPDAPAIIIVPPAFVEAMPVGAPYLPAASLVEMNGGLYLVDGASNLVSVNSADTVAAMGVSTTVSLVSAASVSGWTIASAPLSSVVSCSGTDYIGGSGKLWPVSATLVRALPVTELQPATCAAIPTASAPITKALFVKSASSTTVWEIDPDGRRDAVDSRSTLVNEASAGTPQALVVSQELIDSLPVGPDVVTVATLVRSSATGELYLADGSGGFVPVPNPAVLADMGVSTSAVTMAGSTVTSVGQPLTNLLQCGGTDYLAGSGQFWQLSTAVAGSLGTAMPLTLCAALVTHSQPLASGIVRGETTGTFYTLSDGTKSPLVGGATGPFANVSDSWLASVPDAG